MSCSQYVRALILVGCATIAGYCQSNSNADQIEQIRKQCASILKNAYMSPSGGANCHPETYPGWENFPVQRCTYESEGRKGDVYVLTPDEDRFSRWVVTACAKAAPSNPRACADRLLRKIAAESQAQFPIAGVVLESRNNPCQKCCFRNGVTVSLKGWRIIATQWSSVTPEQFDLCTKGEISYIGDYARIQSTTVDDYYSANGRTRDVGTAGSGGRRTSEWLDVVKASYQAAWNSAEYELMTATAKAMYRHR